MTGTHRPTTPPKVPDAASGLEIVGAHVLPIDCGRMLRKNCEATEVPAVIPANFPAVETTGKPEATAPPAAAVDRPKELAAQDFAACQV